MATRGELRAAVRQRLEDTSATPLWDDATLNGLIADAVRAYGLRVPAERTLTAAVPAGASTIPLGGAVALRSVVAVTDPAGLIVPRARGPLELAASHAQEWQIWAGEVRLALPASGGDWRIDYLGSRATPVDDASVLDLDPGDDAIVTALTVAGALRRRAAEDAKRGVGRGGESVARLAEAAGAEAERLLRARARRALGGWLAAG